MQQITSVWSTLTNKRRVVVIAATLAMFAAVLGLSRIATTPGMSLLYSGLEPGAAGDVVAALDQQGVRYNVRDGAIFVEETRRDALRMTLAAEDLPATNGQGYELLDQLSGFGTTSQMFDAAYWRAKEGELARTITASPWVKAARVHISNPSSNPFQRDQKATASVTVTTTGAALGSGQARALKFLVASAVAGLSPESVSIIDGRGGLVLSGEDDAESVHRGDDRAAELRTNIQRILEARVGHGNVVVEVNVETVTDREAITERTFDPENRVAISSETEERTTRSRGSQGGFVTVASNLPEGDTSGGDNNSSSENSETRERVNFEVSETTREVLRAPGAVKRISVAVLVDGMETVDPVTNTASWEPRPESEIAALRELVASAVGFDESRGDIITLKSMEFTPPPAEEAAPTAGRFSNLVFDVMTLIQVAVLALVSLILGLFVVRPILAGGRTAGAPASLAPPAHYAGAGANSAADSAAGGQPAALFPAVASAEPLTGEIDEGAEPLPQMAVISGDFALPTASAAGSSKSVDDQNDPVSRLRHMIEDRRAESVEILRSWMDDQEEQV